MFKKNKPLFNFMVNPRQAIRAVKEIKDGFVSIASLCKEVKKNVEDIKKLKDQNEGFTSWAYTTMAIGCCSNSIQGFHRSDDRIDWEIGDKKLSLVPNDRSDTLVNKEIAVKIIELNKDAEQKIKWTTEDLLSKEEASEYKESGFIVKKIY